MSENKMEYRGSKSDFNLKFVKEQRVDGSLHNFLNKKCIRCTLMGFERNYQIKIPSKQKNILRTHTSIATHKSTISNNFNLNPWFITGFSDAESSFSILIQHNDKYKTNWRIKLIFAIGLHKKDINLYSLRDQKN